jgi:hypothetical protein
MSLAGSLAVVRNSSDRKGVSSTKTKTKIRAGGVVGTGLVNHNQSLR